MMPCASSQRSMKGTLAGGIMPAGRKACRPSKINGKMNRSHSSSQLGSPELPAGPH